MSPKTGFILVEEVVPRLRALIPCAARQVGADDVEELVQDGIAIAAKMLHDLELRGKEVTPGNIARFAALTIRSGRRSTWAGRTDALCAGAQLDGNSSVASLDETVGHDAETGEEIRLGDLLAGEADDPSASACRNVDWGEFLATHDGRYGGILRQMARGKTVKDIAADRRAKYCRIRKIKDALRADLRGYLGESAIADALRPPPWRGNIVAEHERSACKAERKKR